MSYGQDYSLDYGNEGVQAVAAERAAFIRRTYAHLAGAILALIAIEGMIMMATSMQQKLDIAMWFFGSQVTWILTLVAFMGVSYLANSWAHNPESTQSTQYMGLGLYVIAWSVLLLPLLCIAQYIETRHVMKTGETLGLIPTAGIITLAMFGGLTLIVFVTRKDFSFLRSGLMMCSFLALGLIVASMIFGFSLGLVFIFAMIALMSGYILYDTSNVLHHYHTSQHVAAALTLFADVALMFWYILQLLISLSGRE